MILCSRTARRVRIALSCAAVAGAALAMPQLAGASPHAGPGFCSGSGAVPASALTTPVDTQQCHLIGRLVESATAGAVRVPKSGSTTLVITQRVSGTTVLQVSNKDGHVSAQKQTVSGTPEATTTTGPECSQTNYVLYGGSWPGATNWRYNAGTTARAGLNAANALDQIRLANRNMTLDNAACNNNPRFDIDAFYSGTTTAYANVNSAGQCTARFPDGHDTVSWGPFDAGATDTLATTCETRSGTRITEADIYLGSNRSVAINAVGSQCSKHYDLQSLATHEWGHFFGLAHATGDKETMYPSLQACSDAIRSLAPGDQAGMADLYGYRR